MNLTARAACEPREIFASSNDPSAPNGRSTFGAGHGLYRVPKPSALPRTAASLLHVGVQERGPEARGVNLVMPGPAANTRAFPASWVCRVEAVLEELGKFDNGRSPFGSFTSSAYANRARHVPRLHCGLPPHFPPHPRRNTWNARETPRMGLLSYFKDFETAGNELKRTTSPCQGGRRGFKSLLPLCEHPGENPRWAVWHLEDRFGATPEAVGILRTPSRVCSASPDEACATSWAAWSDIAAPVSTLSDLGSRFANPFSRSRKS